MKKFLILLLDLLFGFIKPAFFILLIYGIQKASIDTYNDFAAEAGNSSMFKERSYDSLNIFLGVSITIFLIIILVMWLIIASMVRNNRFIPAGILSIIFLSVIVGILILSVFRKDLSDDTTNAEAVPPSNQNKENNKCLYCEQILSKTDLFCPYCGAKRVKE